MIKDLKKYHKVEIVLIEASVVVGVFIFFYYHMYRDKPSNAIFVLLMLILTGFLGYLAYKGKSWAKWVLIIPLLFGLNALPFVIGQFFKNPFYCSLYIFQQLFLIIAILLFFMTHKKN